MKTLSVITAALFLAFGVATSRAQNLERISTATECPSKRFKPKEHRLVLAGQLGENAPAVERYRSELR
jgi:hypothetical protein